MEYLPLILLVRIPSRKYLCDFVPSLFSTLTIILRIWTSGGCPSTNPSHLGKNTALDPKNLASLSKFLPEYESDIQYSSLSRSV